jgi:DNA-binding HxlR family transcriptional regulator
MRKEDSTNSANQIFLHKSCKVNEAIDLISGRWKALILIYISEKTNRFSLIKAVLDNKISDQTLGRQLKELEQSNLIDKKIVPGFPVRVNYYLTEKGKALLPILDALDVWTEQHHETKA